MYTYWSDSAKGFALHINYFIEASPQSRVSFNHFTEEGNGRMGMLVARLKSQFLRNTVISI